MDGTWVPESPHGGNLDMRAKKPLYVYPLKAGDYL